jgi:hypothetical protein
MSRRPDEAVEKPIDSLSSVVSLFELSGCVLQELELNSQGTAHRYHPRTSKNFDDCLVYESSRMRWSDSRYAQIQ